jgi:hypothetical protein
MNCFSNINLYYIIQVDYFIFMNNKYFILEYFNTKNYYFIFKTIDFIHYVELFYFKLDINYILKVVIVIMLL